MSSAKPNPFEALATALTTATNEMGNKQTLIRYLRNYYYESNTDGDLIVNEMIDVFEAHVIPTAARFILPHPDTELVVLCAHHIVEDALTPDKIAAWMACQRSK
jgi:hypothetical protein